MAELKQNQIRAQLREMSDDDLRDEVKAQRAALYGFRQKHAMKQLENTAVIRAARKQIARALTILRERDLAAKREAK